MDVTKIVPNRGKIIAKPFDHRKPPPGVILAPLAWGSEQFCKVIAMGQPPHRHDKKGRVTGETPWGFKVGDAVMRMKYAGDQLFDAEDVRYVVLDYAEILGVADLEALQEAD